MYLFEIIYLLNVECRGLVDMIEEFQVELSAVDKPYHIVIHGKFFSIIEVNFVEVKNSILYSSLVHPSFSNSNYSQYQMDNHCSTLCQRVDCKMISNKFNKFLFNIAQIRSI